MITIEFQKQLDSGVGVMDLDVRLEIKKHQLVTISGPSGSGKTSILRMIAGLMKPDTGNIEVDGQLWYDSSRSFSLKIQKRRVSILFQDYALFPNMTIRENLQYAMDKDQNESLIDELLELMQLRKLQHRKPLTLSGGQQQRVALGRALVQKPELLLLDEPLSALDDKTRFELQDLILEMHRKYKITTILVSHDVSEILRLSDHVFLLENGKIKSQGSPEQIYAGRQVSGKFKFAGTVLKVEPGEFMVVLHVLVGNQVIKVAMDSSSISGIAEGDKVIVASKAFNPIVKKI